MTTGDKIKKSVIYILLVLLAAACLFPFLLMMVNATRDGVEITHFFTLIPSTHLKENWETVFSFFNLFRGMANSLLVAVPATLLTAYFSAMTAYGLAMYRFRGNKLIFTAILVFMMIPGQLSLIGFYNLCTKLKLVNSYIPLIVPAVAARVSLCDRFPDFQCVPGIPHTRFKLYRQQAGRNAVPFCRSEKLYTRIYR